ncbi:MAG TPA: hypothetical protein IAC31_06165 [Candidatus Faecousia intestinigallinarum]|nr:hypothetical protein [Candidatus Faecousia intestinigallinarum]
MNEWTRILSNRKRRIAILCIPLVCLALFFFQKCDGNFGALIPDAQDYRALLASYQNTPPEQIAQALKETWEISSNEQRLLSQAEYLRDYPGYLARVQKQAADLQATKLFGGDEHSFVYRNIVKTAKDFAARSADGIRLGNLRTVQDWLAFSPADWGFLAVILLLVMSFMEERTKGLAAIIRSCPAGRGKLQASRLLVLLAYSAGMTLLFYYLPLALSLTLDGAWGDLGLPVQSLAEFQKCTLDLTFSSFFICFFLVKTACGFLLGVLFWFLLSFLEQVQLCWLMTAAGLAAEYLLYTFIPPQSIFSPLRCINVFSYIFTSGLFTGYVNYNFFGFPVSQRTLLLGFLAVSVVVLGSSTVWVLTHRYPFGNRDRLGKWLHLWNRAADSLRRHLGLTGFEWYKLLFMSAGGIFLILGIILSGGVRGSSNMYSRPEDMIYRQYIGQIQGSVRQDTFDYLAEARRALEESSMDTTEFEMALDRLETQIAELEGGAWIVDETAFMNFYGSRSWRVQRFNAMAAMIVLTVCLSPLFACDQNGDVRKVLRSAPGGRGRLFRAKYFVALGVTLLMWLLIFGREWRYAATSMGNTLLAAPCSSIALVKGFPMTVGTFLALLYLAKALAMLIPMHLCIFFGERCGSFEKVFLFSSGTLLLPAAAYYFGADTMGYATPMSLMADGSPLLSGASGILGFALWLLLSLLALFAARRDWCK